MFDEAALTRILARATFTKDRGFVLSALTSSDLSQIMEILDTLWSTQERREFAQKLKTFSLSFPWSEHPAHALCVSALEQWAPYQLEHMLEKALQESDGTQAVTHNPHLAAVLRGLANPGDLGSTEFLQKHRFAETSRVIRPILRAYVLDHVSEAAERRKLGLERALTTQDRYELLACIWRCQQGLAKDAGPQKRTRLWVMLDHAEYLLDYAPTERKPLTNGLLTILSRMQSHFTLWLNCAETDDGMVKEVKNAWGAPLLEYLNFDLTDDATANAVLRPIATLAEG